MEKNALHMERKTLEKIDEDTHIIHTTGSKSKGSPPLWHRVSLLNVSRPMDGVAVIIQFPVKHPVAAEMDARKIYRDRTVMTMVIKSNVSLIIERNPRSYSVTLMEWEMYACC